MRSWDSSPTPYKLVTGTLRSISLIQHSKVETGMSEVQGHPQLLANLGQPGLHEGAEEGSHHEPAQARPTFPPFI